MGTFTSTTVPGCRVPYVWIEGQRSLYDAMGPDYTLLRLDPTAGVSGIVAEAAGNGDTQSVAVSLKMVLSLEGVEYR
jgi:hypothetical protein